MKVLQIVIAPSTGSSTGISATGPERRAANLVGRWREHGVEPIICYPRRGNLWGVFEASGVPLVDFEIGDKLNWSAVSRIARIARTYGAQVIHTQGPPSLGLFGLFAAWSFHCPLVVTRPMMVEDHVYYAQWRRVLYSVIDRLPIDSGTLMFRH